MYLWLTRLFYTHICFKLNMKTHSSIRAQNLAKILLTKYIPAEQINRKFSSLELKGTFEEKIMLEAYKSLGGLHSFPEITFEVPFLEFGRFCVLLDESIHFNRYRARTLRSSLYEGLSSFPAMKYRTYCRNFESECMKVGASNSFWTNTESEYQFGPSQTSGDLGLSGSSGWKLMAFKDFLIDLVCRNRKIRLLRISVWDDLMVQNTLKRINELLVSPNTQVAEQLLKYVDRKVIGLYADDF